MKEKSDSSMALAVRLLKEGRGDALISCGNTGALFTCASLVVRRIRGVRRAVLAAVVPLDNTFVICDSGANTEATPEMLVQFAAMGSIYAKNLLGYESPRVALLNNGSEETKGTELQQKAFELLRADEAEFHRQLRGQGPARRFLQTSSSATALFGNIALKTIEAMGKLVGRVLERIFKKNPITMLGYLFTKRSTNAVRQAA